MLARILPLALTLATLSPLQANPATILNEAKRIVLLGDAFFERDYEHGHLETALTQSLAKNPPVIRNLGWSGDTPRCESRSYFGPPQEGFDRLAATLAEIKPDTIIACYGATDAFQGQEGIEPFIQSYRRLLQDNLEKTGARIILMSPPLTGGTGTRWPSLQRHPENLALYRDAIRKLAEERKHTFADLLASMDGIQTETINGVTFNGSDYQKIAPAFARSLGLTTQISNTPDLTAAIVEKNSWFFHRWRPQNEIYLFGSRKHEQGNNAAEIPAFDPIIAEKETIITKLAQAAAATR
jgi:lysophospholipase L1-like esterase